MPKTIFICQNCGYESSRWEGQCRQCKKWNTFEESIVVSNKRRSKDRTAFSGECKPQKVKDVKTRLLHRISTGFHEVDRALGGGFVPGQVSLIAGDPGIGKSTLLLQIANEIGRSVLYVSAEESVSQIVLRSKRLGLAMKNVDLLSINNIDLALNALSHDFIIVDSIQTVFSDEIESQAGTISQIRACTNKLVTFAKKSGIVCVVVGHITKDGAVAGPKLLEHLVDTVLYLEGDKKHIFRLLKAHKNRFGSDSEVGIFTMGEKGLKQVENPAKVFLQDGYELAPGNVISIVLEGSRPVVVEVQALTTRSSFGYPKRTSNGFSLNRLQLLCAVLQKRLGLDLSNQDVYLNITSGLNVREPAIDLAVCAAIISSFKNRVYKNGTVFFGEVGLSGEVKNVTTGDRRKKEAKNLGFDKIKCPQNTKSIEEVLKSLV